MKRRQFLQSLSVVAGVPALAAAQPAAAALKFNYLLASSMYGDLPLATILPEVKKTGANAIELWPRKHGTQREEMDAIGHDKVAEMIKAEGLTFGGTTRYDLGPFKLTEEIGIVKKMGGSIIVTGGSGEYKVGPEQLKKNVANFVEKMKPHASLAAENGVTIGIENHVNNLIDTPDSLRWLADATRDIPGIGIALAPAHLPQEPELLAELIKHCDKKLTLFYAWARGQGFFKPMPKEEELEQMPGRGKLDWKPLVKALKEIKFNGPTEIFMHHTPRGIPILPTAAEVTAEMARAREFLDQTAATAQPNLFNKKTRPMSEAKVLIVVGDATETVDTLYPFYRLIEGGYKPVVAAPEKRKYQMVLHEVKPGWTITKEWEGYSIDADIAFKDIRPEEYVGIFFSGGRAPEYIREDEDLLRITKWFWEQGKPCASVCHGVEIPARAGIVKGLKMATVGKCKFDLEVCGGIYVNEPCVIDKNMYSGRTYHDSGSFVAPWTKALDAERKKMGI